MSTTTEIPPTEQPKPDHHDEFTGAFGFFRKHQKLILYTAGIFALITFSITGAMTSWVRGLTSGPSGPQPTIAVAGNNAIELDVEDLRLGGQLAQHRLALPPTVLPQFLVGSETSDLATRFAILRRVSLALGLDVSMTEVDSAIGWMVKANNSRSKTDDSATQVALRMGFGSLAEFRGLVKEAMRIGNLVMLDSLGVEYGRLGSIVFLERGPLSEAAETAVRLTGTAPVPNHFASFAQGAEFRCAVERVRRDVIQLVRHRRRISVQVPGQFVHQRFSSRSAFTVRARTDSTPSAAVTRNTMYSQLKALPALRVPSAMSEPTISAALRYAFMGLASLRCPTSSNTFRDVTDGSFGTDGGVRTGTDRAARGCSGLINAVALRGDARGFRT